MERRTKWIIFMAVVLAISILWPLSYMLRQSRPSQANETGPGQPIIAKPIEKYIAQVEANVTSVGTHITAEAFGNSGSPAELESEIGNWTGVSSVNVTRTESSDPNYLYSFVIKVNLSNWTDAERIGFWLSKLLPVSVKSEFVDVNISLPENATFTNLETNQTRVLPIPRNITQLGHTYVKPGKNPVYIYLVMSGNSVERAIAFAGSNFYIPPMQNVFMPMTGNITKLDKAVVLARVPWGTELNSTQLSEEWNASVRFFPARNRIICENATIPQGINYTVENGEQVIEFNNSTNPEDILSRVEGNCTLDYGTLRIEGSPSQLEVLEKEVSKIANIIDAYYLATVEIPEYQEIDGKMQRMPTRYVENVKTYKEIGEVNFTARVSVAFGIPVGVSYGEAF